MVPPNFQWMIDGLTISEQQTDDAPLYIFNNYLGKDAPAGEQRFPIRQPMRVAVKNIRTARPVKLCEPPVSMADTEYTKD